VEKSRPSKEIKNLCALFAHLWRYLPSSLFSLSGALVEKQEL
jgi:hypothetical protein